MEPRFGSLNLFRRLSTAASCSASVIAASTQSLVVSVTE
jgi:hypothetical protein